MSLLLRTRVCANGGVVQANLILNVSSNTGNPLAGPAKFTLLLALEPYARPRYEASRIIRAYRLPEVNNS